MYIYFWEGSKVTLKRYDRFSLFFRAFHRSILWTTKVCNYFGHNRLCMSLFSIYNFFKERRERLNNYALYFAYCRFQCRGLLPNFFFLKANSGKAQRGIEYSTPRW